MRTSMKIQHLVYGDTTSLGDKEFCQLDWFFNPFWVKDCLLEVHNAFLGLERIFGEDTHLDDVKVTLEIAETECDADGEPVEDILTIKSSWVNMFNLFTTLCSHTENAGAVDWRTWLSNVDNVVMRLDTVKNQVRGYSHDYLKLMAS